MVTLSKIRPQIQKEDPRTTSRLMRRIRNDRQIQMQTARNALSGLLQDAIEEQDLQRIEKLRATIQ